jgi:LmbE family N-acetylglucosaminyl deacetylase
MRVLAVGAHPDDVEILCGGTLARFADADHDVVICHAAKGDRGSFDRPADELTRTRSDEARRAADLIGAECLSLGVSDAEIDASNPAQRLAMTDLIRETRPDVVITHSPGDYMGDHNEVSRLVFDTSFFASLPLLKTDRPHHDRVPSLFFMETFAGVGFDPTEWVDITAVIELKARMLECHVSQLKWIRDHDDVDIVEQMTTTARFRGYQSGVRYAEGFRPCLAWLRGRTVRVLP